VELNRTKIKDTLKNTEYFFVGVFVFVVIAIAIMLIVYVPTAASLVKEHAESEVRNAAYINSAAADVFFGSKISFLEAATVEFQDIDLSDSGAVYDACVGICSNGPFRHIGFTGTDGVTVSSTGLSANTSNRRFIQEGLSGFRSVYAHTQCDFTGKIGDMFSVPVYKNGEVVGVLTGEHPTFTFSDITTLTIADDGNCFFIFDADGDVVYYSAGNKLAIGNTDNITDLIEDPVEANDVKYTLNRTIQSAFRHITIGDTPCMAAFAGMSGVDWTFAAIVPSDSVYSSFGTLISFTVMLILLMSLLLLISILVTTIRVKKITGKVVATIEEGLDKIYTDSITGHDTVEKLRENFESAMKNTAVKHAIISLDIDRFKAVNDMFGYEGGNDIIRRLSDVIKMNIGPNDFFARSTGDLFYILAEFGDKEKLCDIAQNIMSDVDYQITEVKINLAIGIYIIEDPHIRSRVAGDRADMARESVKNGKQSRYCFFDSSMIERIRREKKIEDIMEDSLALGEFLVYLQPKYSLGETNEVVGAEALVRWKHDGKLIPPGDFIPLFERNGFVMKLDLYMFEEVCKLQKKYISLGLKPKIISVNMSRLHIHKTGFVAELAAICARYDIETKYIEIEITESAAYEEMAALCGIFREIKRYGFHVSIDDFGTGYSSLNMLKDMTVDVIKIDRSFLTEKAEETENASLIIGCLVMLASSLKISTICEGVETKVQADLLTKLGCDMVQGFYFARPMPVTDYEKLTYGLEDK
jgi:diguanylate cyclase (GGDEF)-like protein